MTTTFSEALKLALGQEFRQKANCVFVCSLSNERKDFIL
jgi:hypothetical protein